jgi:seryl-tRNA synthetase
MPRAVLERTEYVTSFPNLLGILSSFSGGDRELRELHLRFGEEGDWPALMSPTEVAVCSAACHQLYPTLSERILVEAVRVEVQSYCFRHEPSMDPARMQSFRMREIVYVGRPSDALGHRDQGIVWAGALLGSLGLDLGVVEANDPFFGRAGNLLVADQREKTLKFELVAPISSMAPGAIASCNYHEDHFGRLFSMSLRSGDVAHSACIAFGLERITLSLFLKHGLSPQTWPQSVRTRLALT